VLTCIATLVHKQQLTLHQQDSTQLLAVAALQRDVSTARSSREGDMLAEQAAKHLVLLPLTTPSTTSNTTAAAAATATAASGGDSSSARSSSRRELNSSGSGSSVHDDEPMAALQAAARAFDEVNSMHITLHNSSNAQRQ
jgi:hypothetical protein